VPTNYRQIEAPLDGGGVAYRYRSAPVGRPCIKYKISPSSECADLPPSARRAVDELVSSRGLVHACNGWFGVGVGEDEYSQVREIALALPEVNERMSHGAVCFFRSGPATAVLLP
jgi:hypothetical protein